MENRKYVKAEHIEFVLGQVQALAAFAVAIAKTHSDAGDLAAHFQKAEKLGLTNIESESRGEAMLDGFQDLSARLRNALERAASAQESSNNR